MGVDLDFDFVGVDLVGMNQNYNTIASHVQQGRKLVADKESATLEKISKQRLKELLSRCCSGMCFPGRCVPPNIFPQ